MRVARRPSGPAHSGRLFDHAVNTFLDDLATPKIEAAPAKYARDPLLWFKERLGIDEHTLRWSMNPAYETHKWDGTADPMAKVLTSLAEWKSVGVESATGTGKTFLGAGVILWFLDCFENSTVVTTAPKESQLTLNIWKEVSRLWPRFQSLRPKAELTTLRIRMRPGSDVWAAHGFACGVGADEDSATRAQGFHAEHMLIIFEETPGIHPAVMTAFKNTCSDDHNIRLALGNPDSRTDQLHMFCQESNVVPIRVSALDHPNVVTNDRVIPGAVSRLKVDERRHDYGPDSRLYMSRVRGISPEESADALIRWQWCIDATRKTAAERSQLLQGPDALGVDVANSENGDKAALAHGKGAVLLTVESFQCPNANLLASERVVPLILTLDIDQKHVGIDAVGVGAGTVNELKRLGFRCTAIHGGGLAHVRPQSKREEEFNSLRSQMWWQVRVDLQHSNIVLPHDEELFEDLTTPTWATQNGKIVVEPKEKIKQRLGRSPDKGDAVVYWNWVRASRGRATVGGAQVTL